MTTYVKKNQTPTFTIIISLKDIYIPKMKRQFQNKGQFLPRKKRKKDISNIVEGVQKMGFLIIGGESVASVTWQNQPEQMIHRSRDSAWLVSS